MLNLRFRETEQLPGVMLLVSEELGFEAKVP